MEGVDHRVGIGLDSGSAKLLVRTMSSGPVWWSEREKEMIAAGSELDGPKTHGLGNAAELNFADPLKKS